MPSKELLFVYPPDVPGPESAGAAIIRDLPPQDAWMAVKVHRVMSLWAHPHSAGAPVFPMRALEELEKELLYVTWDLGHRDPPDAGAAFAAHLSYMITSLVTQDIVDTGDVAQTCLGVTTWAAERGYYATGSAFMELAAYIAWDCPNWAWLAGRWFRMRGRSREAETWYRRAARLARWNEDWEAMALSLNSLGNLHYECGNYARAERKLQRALRVAHRHSLRSQEGEILHDLFVVAMVSGGRRDAEKYAQAALHLYLPDHPRITALAYDAGYFWLLNGYFTRALSVLRDLQGRFETAEQNLFVTVAVARAAAATGERTLYERGWREAETLIARIPTNHRLAVALVDLGISAASAGEWERAAEWTTRGANMAAELGAADVVARAESVMSQVRSHAPADVERRHERSSSASIGGRLADELISVLGQ